MAWYQQTVDEVLSVLKTSPDGLSLSEAGFRLKRSGPNFLTTGKDRSLWTLFFSQFFTHFVAILGIAASIKFFMGHYLDTIVLLITIAILICIGFFQEMKAEKALRALKNLASHKSMVKREGQMHLIPSEELVSGDIVFLEMGNKVPADGRLIEALLFQVDESMLSGESAANEKSTAPIAEEVGLADRVCMVYSGTVVVHGKALMIVTETGKNTEIGKIAETLKEIEQEPTPLQKNINSIGHWAVVSVLCVTAVLIAIGLFMGMGWVDVLLLAVAAAVSALPEGLPAAFTVTLAAGMRLMAKRNAIIRRLSAVETLGAATLICSDKTGTLTCNQMTVTEIFALSKTIGAKEKVFGDPVFRWILEIGALCNDAVLSKEKEDHTAIGLPTESALVIAAADSGIDQMAVHKHLPRIAEIDFESERRYMATKHAAGDHGLICVKGAPEKVLDMCKSVLTYGDEVALDENIRKQIEEVILEMTSRALRLIAVAYCHADLEHRLDESEFVGRMTFGGIFGITDPPRQEAIEAISSCKKAGVRVVMITGDNPMTAAASAKLLGIPHENVLTGQDLHQIGDEELKAQIDRTSIFARVEPIHKLRLVKAYQAQGHIVAMTGDGINDAPALEAANIGVAMGMTGTDVAKEAADMILSDDRFDSIVSAIEEGRAIFNRLRNICALLLLTCFGELFGLILSVGFTGHAPLLPIQIIWVNLVSGSMISIPLGFEPKAGNEMQNPPRSSNSHLIYSGMAFRIGLYAFLLGIGIFAIFDYSYSHMPLLEARNVTLTSLLVYEWFMTMKMRSDELPLRKIGLFSNLSLFTALMIAIALQMIILHIPFFQVLFQTRPLSGTQWLIAIIPGAFAFLLETLRKEFFPKLFSKGK